MRGMGVICCPNCSMRFQFAVLNSGPNLRTSLEPDTRTWTGRGTTRPGTSRTPRASWCAQHGEARWNFSQTDRASRISRKFCTRHFVEQNLCFEDFGVNSSTQTGQRTGSLQDFPGRTHDCNSSSCASFMLFFKHDKIGTQSGRVTDSVKFCKSVVGYFGITSGTHGSYVLLMA